MNRRQWLTVAASGIIVPKLIGSIYRQGRGLVVPPGNLLAPITYTAVRSGPWDDPTTWHGGRVPVRGSIAIISANLTVTATQVDLDRFGVVGEWSGER